MTSYKIKYSVWKQRIVPILELSGWEQITEGDATYMLHRASRHRFEFRYYGNSAPVQINELEKI